MEALLGDEAERGVQPERGRIVELGLEGDLEEGASRGQMGVLSMMPGVRGNKRGEWGGDAKERMDEWKVA